MRNDTSYDANHRMAVYYPGQVVVLAHPTKVSKCCSSKGHFVRKQYISILQWYTSVLNQMTYLQIQCSNSKKEMIFLICSVSSNQHVKVDVDT